MHNRKMKQNHRMGFVMLALAALVFSGMELRAQDTLTLNLRDALTHALNANQQARKAQLDVENSEYKIEEVRSRALPQLNGTGTLTYNPLLQKSALPNIFGPNPNPDETILVAFGQKWNAVGGVSLSQNLFDKSVLTGLDAARTTREFYKLSAQLTEDQVIEQVATAYYQVLVQRQQMRLLDSTIRNTSRVLNILKGQYDNGLAKKIDVDRVTVNVSNLNSQRQQMLNAIALLENQLKFFMGLPIQKPVRIPEAELDEIKPNILAITDSVDFINRLEYKLLKSQEQLYRYQKESYKAEYYPSLSL